MLKSHENMVTRNETAHRTLPAEGWRRVLPFEKRGERDIERERERERKKRQRKREKWISRWSNVGESVYSTWKDFLPIEEKEKKTKGTYSSFRKILYSD